MDAPYTKSSFDGIESLLAVTDGILESFVAQYGVILRGR
jgi:hypothetical protein